MAAVEAVPEVAGDAAEPEAVDIKAGMEATGPVQGEAAAEIPEGCEAGAGVPAGDVPEDGEAASDVPEIGEVGDGTQDWPGGLSCSVSASGLRLAGGEAVQEVADRGQGTSGGQEPVHGEAVGQVAWRLRPRSGTFCSLEPTS